MLPAPLPDAVWTLPTSTHSVPLRWTDKALSGYRLHEAPQSQVPSSYNAPLVRERASQALSTGFPVNPPLFADERLLLTRVSHPHKTADFVEMDTGVATLARVVEVGPAGIIGPENGL